jgi:hypothetical protein
MSVPNDEIRKKAEAARPIVLAALRGTPAEREEILRIMKEVGFDEEEIAHVARAFPPKPNYNN